ncbi:MAG: hypothetical protein ACOYIP_04855 [Coriobacteriales bacterium]
MKTSKFILTMIAVLALVAMLALAACGGSKAAETADVPDEPAATGPADAQAADQAAESASASEDDPYAGTWELTGFLDENDKLLSVDEYAETADANPSTFPTTYELRADGTAIAHNTSTGDVEATWHAGDHQVTITANGTDYVLMVKLDDSGEHLLTYDDPEVEDLVSVFEKIA